MREQKTADFLAVGAALLFLFLILLTPGQSLGNSREIGILDSAWTCTYGDTRAEVTLPASLSVPGESQVRFSTVLPEQESKGWGIRFRSRLQRVQVFLEETLIYQYPEQEVLGGCSAQRVELCAASRKLGRKTAGDPGGISLPGLWRAHAGGFHRELQ